MGDNIKILLKEVSTKIKDENEKKQQTAEDFNIFEILRITHKELVHSCLLAELLNPKGTHKQGLRFLNKFIDEIKNKIKKDRIELKDEVSVSKEVSFNNGRVDILIEDKDNIIIIENKIYAGDQDEQLLRYYNSIKSLNKNKILVYLTPDGRKPTKYSLGMKNSDSSIDERINNLNVYPLSYNNIKNVIKTKENDPENLKVILNQYEKIIEVLANGKGDKMSEGIKEYIKQNQELIAAYVYLKNVDLFPINTIRNTIKTEIAKQLKSKFQEKKMSYEWSFCGNTNVLESDASKNKGFSIVVFLEEKDSFVAFSKWTSKEPKSNEISIKEEQIKKMIGNDNYFITSKSGYTIYRYLNLDLDLENRSWLESDEGKYNKFIENTMEVVEKFIKCAENYISKQSAS